MHGRAEYPINYAGQHPFRWWVCLLFLPYTLLLGLRVLVQSWLWRDHTRYPYWQNHIYESEALAYNLHRLGMWSAYIQTLWPLRLHKRSRHDA